MDIGLEKAAAGVALSVAIVEDQREIREGLSVLLGGTPGFRCIGAFRSIEDALAGLAAGTAPDVILLDIGLPGMSGIDALPILKEKFPAAQPVVLTVHQDDDRIFRAICAGARGYLLKSTPPSRLLDALREAAEGGAPLTPSIAAKVFDLFQRVRPSSEAPAALSAHELRVLRLLAQGHSYRGAAEDLGVTQHAVSFHVRRIYDKLQVHTKSAAVARALRDGLID